MTTFLVPVTGEVAVEDATPGCGCCVPPPDASVPEGRELALAELHARRNAVERRLQGLR